MILHVSSADDPAAAAYRHVGDAAWLEANRLFVAEGRLVVERLIRARRHRIESILTTPSAAAALAAAFSDADVPILVAPQPLLNDIAGFNFHRGCLALAERPMPDTLDDIARGGLLLGLEAVGNPDNVGGLFRTAAAFGVAGVVIDDRTGDPFYRKALRTSMAAVLRLPFATVSDWPAAAQGLRSRGYRIVALTPDGSAIPLPDFAETSPHVPLLVLVGAEGPGLAAATVASADDKVRIPIAPDVDSLNVTVAAGIALAALRRRG